MKRKSREAARALSVVEGSSRHPTLRRQEAPELANNQVASSPRRTGRGGQARELQATVADPRAVRRGGQPGNHNALKHGFYSAVFKESERRLLDQIPLTDLSAEIELIRVTNKRFLAALLASKGELDFEAQLSALRAVNLSAHSIGMLLRAHALTAAIQRDADLMATPDSPHLAQDQVVKP